MTARTLISRSLRFHWRAYLGVVLGAAIGSAALIGALIVGDSVRASLRERALERVGWIHAAMDLGDRLIPPTFYNGVFSREFTNTAGQAKTVQQSAAFVVLKTTGTMSRQDGTARANQVNVLGIASPAFLNPPPGQSFGSPQGSVILNAALAQQIQAKPGEDVILRVHKPSSLSREAVISPQSDTTVSLRLKVESITPADKLGNFSLQQNQVPPLNAFVNRDELNRALGLGPSVNLLLGGAFEYQSTPRLASWLLGLGATGKNALRFLNRFGVARIEQVPIPTDDTTAMLNRLVPRDMVFEAAGLSVARPEQNIFELRTSRIFLDPPVTLAATNLRPSAFVSTNTVPILTYLVNAMRSGTNLTPYSMVTAAGQPYTPADLKDDEIVVNEWLAEDLGLRAGSEIELSYFLADSAAQLVERTNKFRVRSVVPLDALHGDRSLMPDFPGISKAETTHDWDAGFPLTYKIRPKDDAYWKEHRGTPKAFITLAAGQRLWANRFGELTAIRWFASDAPAGQQPQQRLREALSRALKPAELGLQFEPVREQALKAASESQDFGGLFIGFSFFLIGAALILMALLFQFGLEQRAAEIGTLLALGFPARRVRRIFLLEGAALAFVGSVIGVAGGIFYAHAMLHGLTTVWRSATNTSALTFHAAPVTILIGLISGTLVAVITIWFVLRKQARQPVRALLAGDLECGDLSPPSPVGDLSPTNSATSRGVKKLRQVAALQSWFRASVLAWASFALAIITIAAAYATGETSNPGYFFSAGSLALIAGLAFTSWFMTRTLRGRSADSHVRANLPGEETRGLGGPRSVTSSVLSIRGAARRKNRSVATVALLASGVFLIASIGAFRLDAEADAWKRSSGTGGFALKARARCPS